MDIQLLPFVKTHTLKRVNYTLFKLYFNNETIKRIQFSTLWLSYDQHSNKAQSPFLQDSLVNTTHKRLKYGYGFSRTIQANLGLKSLGGTRTSNVFFRNLTFLN